MLLLSSVFLIIVIRVGELSEREGKRCCDEAIAYISVHIHITYIYIYTHIHMIYVYIYIYTYTHVTASQA